MPVLEEGVHDEVAPVLVVEEDVQAPVHEPGALLHLLEHRREGVGVDQLLQLRHVLQRHVPGATCGDAFQVTKSRGLAESSKSVRRHSAIHKTRVGVIWAMLPS